MSEDGKNIIAMIQQLRTFFEQVSLLLATADTLMAKDSWKPAAGSACCAGISYALHLPRYWLPQDLFRFYKRDDRKHILTFVSVLLPGVDDATNVEEPLLTAGWFDYGAGQEVGDNWEYSYARWHLRMPEGTADGKLRSAGSEMWQKENPIFRRVSTLGRPLTDITNAGELGNAIIDPLLQGITPERAEG